MELRQLGANGPQVSAIGLGTTKFGRNEGVKYPTSFALPSEAALRELLAVARENGINLLDTAPAYGSAEERIGRLTEGDGGWVIATKAGETFADGRSHFDFSPAAIADSIENSRRRLRRDVLDLVLLHSSGDDLPILNDSGAMETLRELKARGRIGAIGASTKTVEGGLRAVEICDVVMVTLNASDRTQLPVIRAAERAGKGVLIKKPLDSGHQAAADNTLGELVGEQGVTAVIVGTINHRHIVENCAAVERART